MQKLKLFLKWSFFVYLIGMGIMYVFQKKVIFQPEKLPKKHCFQFNQPFEEFYLETKDKLKLNAIHFKNKDPKGVILYFHGNKGNLVRWGRIASFFAKKNYDVIVMDYRSYGKNDGDITEDNLYIDAQLFYDYAFKHYIEKDIIIYGRSLGTGIATKIASQNRPSRLILETPYYSLEDIISTWLPFFPVRYLIKYKFPSNENINKIHCPIIIFHGTADKVVPYASGLKLYHEISGTQKKMVSIHKGQHNNLINYEEYRIYIDKILENH